MTNPVSASPVQPRHRATYLFIPLVALLLTSPALAGGDVNFTYDWRSLQDDSWEPVDDQEALGLAVNFGAQSWPINIAVGYSESSDKATRVSIPLLGDVDQKGELSEWSLGLQKTWNLKSPARPFVGGGLTRIDAKTTFDSALGDTDDSDSSTGVYIDGGLMFRLAGSLNLGIHGRLVEGTDITLFDVDGDSDYYEFGFLVGFGWPARK